MGRSWWRATRVKATVALALASATAYLWAGRAIASRLLPPARPASSSPQARPATPGPLPTASPLAAAAHLRSEQVREIASLTQQLSATQATGGAGAAAGAAQQIDIPALPPLPPVATTRASAV